MKDGKTILQTCVRILAMFALALLLAVCCRDLVGPGMETLGETDARLIDSFTLADSTVTLKEAPTGQVYFQAYRESWLLPRRERIRNQEIGEEPYCTAVVTPLAEYPVTVTRDKIEVGTQKTGLNFGQFCVVYGILTALFLYIQVFVYEKRHKNKKS